MSTCYKLTFGELFRAFFAGGILCRVVKLTCILFDPRVDIDSRVNLIRRQSGHTPQPNLILDLALHPLPKRPLGQHFLSLQTHCGNRVGQFYIIAETC